MRGYCYFTFEFFGTKSRKCRKYHKNSETLDAMSNKIDRASDRIKELRKVLALPFGEDNCYAALHGVEYRSEQGQYTYYLKIFDEGKQGGTRLGTWGEWTDREFTKQHYSGGYRTWNDIERDLDVEFVCKPQNGILKVTEPSMGHYFISFGTRTTGIVIDFSIKWCFFV